MKANTNALLIAVVLFSLGACGCASSRPIPYSGIASSQQLRPNPRGDSDRIPYEYSAGADLRDYSGILVDPVVVYRGNDHQFESTSDEEKAALADYLYQTIRDRLRTRYRLARKPSAENLRLRVTLTGAKLTKRGLGTATRFDVAGGTYNIVQSIRGKEGAMTGSVSFAVELYDSSTDRLLLAYIEKQYPNAMNVKATWGTLEAAKVGIRKGSDDLVRRLE